MYITLNQAKEWNACKDGYKKILSHVGLSYDKDRPINLSAVLEVNGIDDLFWCLENIELTRDQERDFRLFAWGCAEDVLPIYEKEYPEDDRVRNCIDMAKRYAVGEATEKELDAALDAARDATRDAALDALYATRAATRDAALAARAALDAARAVTRDAALAARDALDAARAATRAALYANRAATRAAAWAATLDAQKEKLLVILKRQEEK